MYAQWLYFFNSPLKEISIKGKKQKQIVTKEWLNDGSMKISGDKPSNWSITLQSILSTDIPTLQYDIQNDEIKAKHLFQRAFKGINKELFNEGEQLYSISEKNKKDLINLLNDNNTLLKNIQEKIFQIKRNIYLINIKKPVDLNKVKKLSLELEAALLENMNISKGINNRENNYILKPRSILRSGPTPDPPNVKSLSIKVGREKDVDISQQSINSDKDIEGLEPVDIENVENIKDSETSSMKNVKSGGYIKVIKL